MEPTSDAVTAGVVALPIPASSGWMAGGLADVFLSGGRRIDPSSESTKSGESSDGLTYVHVDEDISLVSGRRNNHTLRVSLRQW